MKNKYHYEITEEYWPNGQLYTFRIECWFGTQKHIENVTWEVNKKKDFDQIGYLTCESEKDSFKIRKFFENLVTEKPFKLSIDIIE